MERDHTLVGRLEVIGQSSSEAAARMEYQEPTAIQKDVWSNVVSKNLPVRLPSRLLYILSRRPQIYMLKWR